MKSRLPCWSMGFVVVNKKKINNSGNSKDQGGGWSIDVALNGLKAKRNIVRALKKNESGEEIPGEWGIYIGKQTGREKAKLRSGLATYKPCPESSTDFEKRTEKNVSLSGQDDIKYITK